MLVVWRRREVDDGEKLVTWRWGICGMMKDNVDVDGL